VLRAYWQAELDQMGEEAQKLLQHNQALESELQNSISKLLRRFETTSVAARFTGTTGQTAIDEEMKEMQERLNLYRDQMELVRVQEGEMKTALDQAQTTVAEQKAELTNANATVAQLSAANDALQERLKKVGSGLCFHIGSVSIRSSLQGFVQLS